MTSLFKKYDSWTLERISRHVLYWLLWSLFYVSLNSCINGEQSFTQWALFELAVLPIKVICTIIIAYLVMPKYLYNGKYTQLFLFSAIIYFIFGVLLYFVYCHVVYPHILNIEVGEEYTAKFVYKGIELLHISSLVICFKFYQSINHQDRVSASLREAKTDAELKYLKNQIQPHFLFNTLNNIYGLHLIGDERVGTMLVKLSDTLSFMLYETDVNFVSLGSELKNISNYIELEQLRYERKLTMELDFPTLHNNIQIAPLILLPFIENAFKHGPAGEDEHSIISIIIKVDSNQLLFNISNTYNAKALTNIKSGIGLENVKKRLELLYPNKHELKIHKAKRYTVDLKLDLN